MLGHANIDANDPSPTSIFTFNRDTLILPLVSSRTGGSRNDRAFGHWRVRRRRKMCLPGLFRGGDQLVQWAEKGGDIGDPWLGKGKLFFYFWPPVPPPPKSAP